MKFWRIVGWKTRAKGVKEGALTLLGTKSLDVTLKGFEARLGCLAVLVGVNTAGEEHVELSLFLESLNDNPVD